MEYKTLNNGLKMPMVGLGVYNISERETQRVVEDAVSVGYRSIDTAAMYYNEKGVGDAVRACGVPREELFITTKICDSCYTKEETLRTVDHSMKQLGLDYVDLMLIHWPVGNPTVMWHTLEELYEQGVFKAIGVSNFYPNTFPKIVNDAKVMPVVNQCETHVLYQQRKMLEYLKPYNTALEAWSPLAEGKPAKEDAGIPEAVQHGIGSMESAGRGEARHLQEQDADEYRREIRQDICTGGLEVLDSERHCHYPQDDAQGKDDGEHQSL